MNRATSETDDLADDDINGARAIYGAAPKPSLSLPARSETIAFRQALEGKYRDGLAKPASATFVDLESVAIWSAEYIGYRVNGCEHAEAITRVFAQVEGRGVQPRCSAAGSITQFPSAGDTVAFRSQLETEYRDVLRRAASSSSVDADGDATWVSEYVRLRLTGSDHDGAIANVMSQVDVSSPTPGGASGQLAISTSISQPFQVDITINGRSIGALKQPVDAGAPPSCTAVPDTRLVVSVAAGDVTYSARSTTGVAWEGSIAIPAGQCLELRLGLN